MSPIVALVAASMILLFWRQVLFLIAWAILALILLGIVSLLQPTDQPAPAASASANQVCTRLP